MQDSQTVSYKTVRQPRLALNPPAFTLDAAEQWALEKTSNLPPDRFRLTSLWYMDWYVQHLPTDRKTRYTARLAQTDNYGIACGLTSTLQDTDRASTLEDAERDLVGEDCRQVLKDRRYCGDMDRTALIDLVMGHLPVVANDHVIVDQERSEKYARKSRLFADETEAVLARKGSIKGSKPHVHVIGAMAGTHAALIRRGFKVTATDMAQGVVGENLGGVMVYGAMDNRRLIDAADLTIITGMTFPNGTLPGLIELAKASNTSTMIWAVTGRNLGHYYVVQGIDCVISDPAPFLQLPGPASIAVWRREH